MKNITIENYFRATQKLDINSLPEKLIKGHEFVKKITGNGEDWNIYDTSASIKAAVKLQIEKLNEHLNEDVPVKEKATARPRNRSTKPRTRQKNRTPKRPTIKYNLQERIPEEIRLLRRFVNLHDKSVNPDQVLRIINALQKAMIEKRIRKTSPFAPHIITMQDKLVKLYSDMKATEHVKLQPKLLNQLRSITQLEKVFPSVQYIKRFIGLHGKMGIHAKALRLIKNLEWAAARNIVTKSDPYKEELNNIYERLKAFVNDPKTTRLTVSSGELNGLNGIVEGCNCDGLDGFDFDDMEEPALKGSGARIMNSIDFGRLAFDTIGFRGKWLELIGDPSPGFSVMVFGKPKMGKSYLCVDFAGYLARNHGKVLYVAREEQLDATLQKKLRDKNVEHPKLDVADDLPDSLRGYDFVFLDSVNKLGLSHDQLDELRLENPNVSFVFVFQTTKQGNFRGGNEFQHDVDVVIEVPEFGKAIQFGRFNQGGEIAIFDPHVTM